MKIDIVFLGMLSVYFFVVATFTLPMAFFPKVAKDKGIGQGYLGFMLGSYDLG